ncbi:hypothetical protein CATMIT_01762 [Catenibacterium mitsuokai DSM 15897]|nr:hypothetical protein CATMIT_01762 [Catenibacterium mitsuokai DSM 15897]
MDQHDARAEVRQADFGDPVGGYRCRASEHGAALASYRATHDGYPQRLPGDFVIHAGSEIHALHWHQKLQAYLAVGETGGGYRLYRGFGINGVHGSLCAGNERNEQEQ